MRYVIPTIVLLLTGLTAASHGSPEVEQAQRELDQAEQRLTRARDLHRQHGRRYDELRRLVHQLAAAADQADRDAIRLEQERRDAQNALPRLEQELEIAQRSLADAERSAADARGALQAADDAAAARRVQLKSDFAQSEPNRAAQAAVEQATADEAAQVQRVHAEAALKPEYVALRAKADQLKLRAETLRGTPGADPAVVARQSQEWMDAETRAGEFLTAAENNDEPLSASRQVLRAARQAQQRVQAEFEQSLRDDKQLSEHQQAAGAARQAIAQSQASVKQWESRSRDRRRVVVATQQLIATADANVRAARSKAQSLRNEHAAVERDLQLAEQQLRTAEIDIRRAEQDVQRAAAQLRELLQRQPDRS